MKSLSFWRGKVAVKIALPKGRLLRKTAALLQKADWRLDEYHSSMGFYRAKSGKFPDLLIRVFHEKDIPIQIAVGNYDLGICGLDWVEELLAKYPTSAVLKVADLGYGRGNLYLAASSHGKLSGLQDLSTGQNSWRIVTEYPNLAESAALNLRLRRFRVLPLVGVLE